MILKNVIVLILATFFCISVVATIAAAVPYDKNAMNEVAPNLDAKAMSTGVFENISTEFNTDHTVNMWATWQSENATPAFMVMLGFYKSACNYYEGVRDLTIYIGNKEMFLGHWTCKRELIDLYPETIVTQSDALAAATVIAEVQKTITDDIDFSQLDAYVKNLKSTEDIEKDEK